jgi:Predicted membrane protein
MKTKKITFLSLLIAIEIILMFTPLGYIPIGPIRATTLHIPVITAGIILGIKEGAILGFVFGLSSLIMNTISPTGTSFVFSPFVTVAEIKGNLASIAIAFIPRILLGVVSGLVFKILTTKTKQKKETIAVIIASLCGALTNTILVLSGIYLFFGSNYADAVNISYNTLLKVISTIIATNGLLEASIGALIVLALYKALNPTINKK